MIIYTFELNRLKLMNDLLILLCIIFMFYLLSSAMHKVLTIESDYKSNNIRKIKENKNITLN